jgi:hypothetical protein
MVFFKFTFIGSAINKFNYSFSVHHVVFEFALVLIPIGPFHGDAFLVADEVLSFAEADSSVAMAEILLPFADVDIFLFGDPSSDPMEFVV